MTHLVQTGTTSNSGRPRLAPWPARLTQTLAIRGLHAPDGSQRGFN